MIPGTIEEWKAALASSKPGSERNVCVEALQHFGVAMQRQQPGCDAFDDWKHSASERFANWRVKPTHRPWNAEDARRHVGFAYRFPANSGACHIIMPWHCDGKQTWTVDGGEYATPIPGTDPSTWNWQKCEVVE